MNNQLRELLEKVVEMDGNNNLWPETTAAAKKLLEGGYEGHSEDIEALDDRNITTGFELEDVLSQGSWYFQDFYNRDDEVEDETETKNLCPDCKVYCEKRFVDGRCE